MGVASPLQSGKPIEYWLDGLKAAELVALWEFLSGNRSEYYELDRDVFDDTSRPTGEQVRKHIYCESLPSSFYACKDRGYTPSEEPPPGAQ